MANNLTAAQMAAAPLMVFDDDPLAYQKPSTSYSAGTVVKDYFFYVYSSTPRNPGTITKFYFTGGDSYSISSSSVGPSNVPRLYDATGAEVALALSHYGSAMVGPGTAQMAPFVAPASGFYYVDPAWDIGTSGVFYNSATFNVTDRHTVDLTAFVQAGPRAGDQRGAAGNDSLTATRASNTLWGLDGNDTFSPGPGGNSGQGGGTMFGGNGIDTVVFDGQRADYSVTRDAYGVAVIKDSVNLRNGVSALIGVERVRFSDVQVAVDVDGAGGQAYRLYQAAFDRKPDAAGLGFHIRNLDKGVSLRDVAQGFVGSPEFSSKYGSLDNSAFVTQFYANVLHRAPDAGGLAYHVDNLAHGMARSDVLVGFSESPENKVALVGVESAGMVYA